MTVPTFAHLLRTYRTRAGLSQSKLAERCGYDNSAFSRLEAGTRRPSREMAATIARVLQLHGDDRTALYAAAFDVPLPAELDPLALSVNAALAGDDGRFRALLVAALGVVG